MVYTIRYNQDQINPAFSKGGVIKKAKDNSDVPVREFDGHAMPETTTTIRILKDQNRVPFVRLTQEELDLIVPSFGLIDDVNKKVIKTANVNLGVDDFWNHPELSLEINNFDTKLSVTDINTTPIAYFWLQTMKADPRFWVNDGTQERPENLRQVEFIVTPEGKEVQKVVTKELSEDTFNMYNALFGMPRINKMLIIDELGEGLYDKIETTDSELVKLIVKGLSDNPFKRVYTGETFEDFVTTVSKFEISQVNFYSLIKNAIREKVITWVGDAYYFENYSLGGDIQKVQAFIDRVSNKKIKDSIWKAMKDKNLLVD